jgi:predicted aminopeptidase
MIRSLFRPLLLLLLLAAAAGCSPTYVLRASWEQAKILSRRQPIERLVEDPQTDSVTRAKLRLVVEARDFAAEVLHLDVGRSYTTFARVDSDTLLHVLSGSRKDAFQPHTWWFPIVGRVPYKGFFDRAAAEREEERLRRRGLDTYLRPAGAFSTLGWFNDPLLSTLLRGGEVRLGNTVIHEVTHNTFFAPGQVRFNESFATFVGSRGAILFFCGRDGEESRRCRQARGEWHDDLLFGQFLTTLLEQLEALYAREDLTAEQKVELREAIFQGARRRFREELRPRFQVSTFASFEQLPLNNATLVGRRLYFHRLELFDEVFRRYGEDLPLTIRAVIAAARGNRDDPYAGVEALLGPQPGLNSR